MLLIHPRMRRAPLRRPLERATPDTPASRSGSFLDRRIGSIPSSVAAHGPALIDQFCAQVRQIGRRASRYCSLVAIRSARQAFEPAPLYQSLKRPARFQPAAPLAAIGIPAELVQFDRIDTFEPHRASADAQAIAVHDIDLRAGRIGQPLRRAQPQEERQQTGQQSQTGEPTQPALEEGRYLPSSDFTAASVLLT